MKEFIIVAIIICLFSKANFSQTCETDTIGLSKIQLLMNSFDCEDYTNYSPFNPAYTPIKTVRLSFHVFQNDNGTGNFINNDNDRLYLNSVIGYCNSVLSSQGTLNIGNSIYIEDTRIRYKLENIYFHPHTEDINFSTSTQCAAIFTKYIINDFDNYGLTSDDKYNTQHILIGNPTSSLGGRASDLGRKGWINEAGWYNYYQLYGSTNFLWPSDNLIHEFGHSMGLYHNFQGGPSGYQCDECSDNDQTSGVCPTEASSSNFMDYWPAGWASSLPGFSQCQLSVMHFLLSGRSNIGDIVLTDYCNYNPANDIDINSTVNWHSDKTINGNITINGNSILTVNCRVKFAKSSKIVIKPGGKLIIDGGMLTNACDSAWQGIEV